MKERPILFNGAMVRAILEGQKTVTRRAVKVQPFDLSWSRHDHRFEYVTGRAENGDELDGFHAYTTRHGGEWSAKCPYGQPGDRLWVRETFALLGNEDGCCIDWNDNLQKGDEKSAARIYKASCSQGDYGLWEIPDKADWKPDTADMLYEGAWRPSIHMPRWACRILLEITAVRAERLQDITPEQCLAEGIEQRFPKVNDQFTPDILRGAFIELWDSTGGEWRANPWVWVVEFKRVTP